MARFGRLGRLGEVVGAGPGAGPSAPPEPPAPTEPTGPICVDVGEERGALVLESTARQLGLEVEIYRDDDPSSRLHVYVLKRSTPAGVVYAGVFPSLEPGPYRVVETARPGQAGGAVEACAGELLTVWPGAVTYGRWGS